MQFGLRLQILLLLAGLLACAYLPVLFALASYSSFVSLQIRVNDARLVGSAVGAELSEASQHESAEELNSRIQKRLGASGVLAVGLYGTDGGLSRVLPESARSLFPPNFAAATHRAAERPGAPTLLVTHSHRFGGVAVFLNLEVDRPQAFQLARLTGLYMAVIALAVLVLAYAALTRLIVQPFHALGRAAELVASGSRRFLLPDRLHSRELRELSQAIQGMAERLMQEEALLLRKVAEVELATQKLKGAQNDLVRSERLASVGRLAAGLAHELGNPISALMGLEDLLLEGGLDTATEREFLERMRRETERIHRILRDLMQLARPPGGPPQEPAPPGNVAQALADTLALLAPQKAMHQVRVHSEVDPDLPEVRLGRDELVQILLNLLLNAADAVRTGGEIRVRAGLKPGSVELTVEDTGPGVAAEVREHLFEPFVTTKETGKGTGLGLAVCRGLVETAGGSIHWDGSYGDGARFVVQLPRADLIPILR